MPVETIAAGSLTDPDFVEALANIPPEQREQVLATLEVCNHVLPMSEHDQISISLSLAATVMDNLEDPKEALAACHAFRDLINNTANSLVETINSTKH